MMINEIKKSMFKVCEWGLQDEKDRFSHGGPSESP